MSIFNYLLKNWFGGKRNKYYTQHTKKGYTDYRTNEKKEQFKQQKKRFQIQRKRETNEQQQQPKKIRKIDQNERIMCLNPWLTTNVPRNEWQRAEIKRKSEHMHNKYARAPSRLVMMVNR